VTILAIFWVIPIVLILWALGFGLYFFSLWRDE